MTERQLFCIKRIGMVSGNQIRCGMPMKLNGSKWTCPRGHHEDDFGSAIH